MAVERIRYGQPPQPEQEERKSFEDIENIRAQVRIELNQNRERYAAEMVNIHELEEERNLQIAIQASQNTYALEVE